MKKIVVDCYGGDNAPEEIVKGALDALDAEKNLSLILTGNYIYCAELPDYDVYEFLKTDGIAPEKRISRKKTCIYTPEDLYEDYYMRRINFSDTDTLFAEED